MTLPLCVHSAQAGCGEGPLWDTRRQCLWWVDISGQAVHRFEPGSGATHRLRMPCLISALAMRTDGRLLIATERGLGVLGEPVDEPITEQVGTIDILHDPEPTTPGNRLNDMTVAPDGCVWAGTMSEGAKAASGALYRYGENGVETMMSGTTVSNGLEFSEDGERLHFIDSVPGTLHVRERGEWRVLRQFDDTTGKPDGLSIDSAGTLWIAVCDRGRVISMTPDGRITGQIELPCRTVTNCAFGGAELRTLYVTTGTFTLDDEQRTANPLAGGLFAIEMQVPGRAPFDARWPDGPLATHGR